MAVDLVASVSLNKSQSQQRVLRQTKAELAAPNETVRPFCLVTLLFFRSCMCSTLSIASPSDPARRVDLVCWSYVLVGSFTVRLTVSGLPVLVICATATKFSVEAPSRVSLLTPWFTIVGA